MRKRAETQPGVIDPQSLRNRLDFSDAELLRECDIDTYRASGPGGQKRNKTSSAIRLRHRPSGIIVTAVETRSQHQNKHVGLERLREAIALACRRSAPAPADVNLNLTNARQISAAGGLRIGTGNPLRWHVLAEALDALAWADGSPAVAAAMLGCSTSALVRFFAARPKAWQTANEIRAANRLPPLIDR